MLERFNWFVYDQKQLISAESFFMEVVQWLLAGQSLSAADIRRMSAIADDMSKLLADGSLSVQHIPAMYCKGERRMLYPLRLDRVECFDDKGNQSEGFGAFAAAFIPNGGLAAIYSSFTVSAVIAEELRQHGSGMHLKTAGPTRGIIFHGARLNNGIFDIDCAVQHVEVIFSSLILCCK